MMQRGIAKKYALALFRAMSEKESLDECRAEFGKLKAFMEENKKIKQFLYYYPVKEDLKKDVIRKISEGFLPEFVNFLLLLVEKKRFSLLDVIEDEYVKLVNQAQGVETAQVTTPQALEEDQKEKLISVLSEVSGKTIELKEIVDPDIIGGFVVRLGDSVFDASVTTQLQKLYQQTIA